MRALYWVINKIWEEEVFVGKWMEGIVSPIFKKGDDVDCGIYRTITLLSAAYTILPEFYGGVYHRLQESSWAI